MTLDDEIGRAAAEAKDERGHRWIWISFAVLLLGALALGTVYFVDRNSSRDALSAQDSHIGALAAQAEKAAADGQQLADQVRALGGTPVVEPSKPATAAPVTDPAALRAAARSALGDYCAPRNQCKGADGAAPNTDGIVNAVVARIPVPTDGTDGQNATQGQVTAAAITAVNGYCGQASEPCRGAPGANGTNGQNGERGEKGDPGPTCPPGLELRDAVITAPDGSTYSGKACVDPNSSQPPSTPPPASTTEPAPLPTK